MRYRPYRRAGRFVRNGAAAASLAGVFVSLFAVGAWRWDALYAGAGLFAAAGVAMAAAYLYGRERMWVQGRARVLSASPAPTGAFGDCELRVVVDAPGSPSHAVRIRQYRVAASLWPVAGETLPVQVDAYNPRRVQVRWDQVSRFSHDYDDHFVGTRGPGSPGRAQ
ncbi:hypothetical protein [Rhizocola hellebori]|nr:hypothetical protein [Rhizocola hellebori]